MNARRTFIHATAAVLALCSLCVSASAIHMPFVLTADDGTLISGNPQSPFYQIDAPSSESGAAAGLFDYVFDSDAGGDFVLLSWGANAKPIITGAALKAGSKNSTLGGLNAIVWDLFDFAAFNSSATYDAIKLYQDGIEHKSNGQFLGISHATLSGSEAEPDVRIPDTGSTFALLGFAIALAAFFKTRIKR